MSSGDRYESGMVSIEYNGGEPVIALPHQCVHWTIGGITEAQTLLRDLGLAVDAMSRGDLKRCEHVTVSFIKSLSPWRCESMVIGEGKYCRDHKETNG